MTSDTRQFRLSACALKLCVYFVSIITLLTSLAAVALAQTGSQTAARPDRGIRHAGSYAISDIENISLTNGNVNLSIPLASLPPIAGGDLSWTLRAVYNSKLWDKPGFEIFQAPPLSNYTLSILQLGDSVGWRIGHRYSITLHQVNEDYEGIQPQNDQDPDWELRGFKWKMMLTTPDGAKHELRPIDFLSYPFGQGNHDYQRGYYKDTPAANSVNATMRYYSFDGSHIWAKIDPFPAFVQPQSWSVYLPDGTIVENSNGIQRIKDTNGNKIKIFQTVDGAGRGTTHYQDELTGREILAGYNPATDTSGLHYQTVGGSWATIEINHGTTRVFGKTYLRGDPCLTEGLIDTEINVIRSIVYPATKPGAPRLQYTFSYNSDTTDSSSGLRRLDCVPNYQTIIGSSEGLGSLSQVVTPMGATVEYSYLWDGRDGFDDPTLITGESITQKRVTHDGITDIWDYSVGFAGGEVKGPDGSITEENSYFHDPGWAILYQGGGNGLGGLAFRTKRKLGPSSNPITQVTIERHWTRLIFNGGNTDAPGDSVGFNPVVDAEYTTLHDSNGAPVKMSAKTFQHDFNGNITQIIEYVFFDPNLVSRDAAGVPTGVPGGATVLRVTNNSHYNQATGATSPNVYAKRTLPDGAPLILNAPRQTTVGDSQTLFSYDNQAHGAPPTSGNLTKVSSWDNINGQWLDTTFTYDSFGNKTSVTDPRGHVTQHFYEDATHANQTKVVVNPGTSPATEQATTMVYDYHTGAPLSLTDPNNQTTDTDYTNQFLGTPDPYLRPGVVTGPPATSQRRKVKTTYDDNARQMIVESDLNTSGDYKLKARTTADQLGRTILTEKNEDGASNYTISNQTIYVQMGKITLASNPKRSGSATIDGWTRTTSDDLGRVIEVATFSGATQPPNTGTNSNWTGSVTTNYNANQTTVTDQAGKKRRSESDALGRLVKVTEDPGGLSYDTTYFYDPLDNLRYVGQGAQGRWFSYDSLSRLIRVKNPEQAGNPNLPPHTDPFTGGSGWAMAYSYDANGNLVSKTDARNITTTYGYDAINRNTTVSYSDSTPSITHTYDTATLGKGRLQKAETAGGMGSRVTINAYDAMGRPLSKSQQFFYLGAWGTSYTTQQTYDLAGNIKTLTYPSGHTVDYSYDQAGRLSSFSGNLGGSPRTYADTIGYNAAGQMIKERFGTNTSLYHNSHYNNRQQLVSTRVGDSATDESNWSRGAIDFFYGSTAVASGDKFANDTDNNGNLRRQINWVPLAGGGHVIPQRDDYIYDALNRVSSFTEAQMNSGGQWTLNVASQSFSYDRYGNRQITSASGGVSNYNPTYDTTNNNNRIVGLGYDAAGSITSDPLTGGTMTYDAENRLLTATSGGGGNYVYNADGKRVRRITAGQEIWHVYGCGGELLAEYEANAQPTAPLKEYGYRGGQLLIVAESGSGGGVSFVKPAMKPGDDLIGKAGLEADDNADGLSVVDEPVIALGINEGHGSITAAYSDSDSTGTHMKGGPRTTTEEYGKTPSANDIGGELLAEYPPDAAPSASRKEYGYRIGRSIVTAQSGGSVNPTANQTPDSGQGGTLAVTGISNTGHGSTPTGAGVTPPPNSNQSESQARSAKWSSFQSGGPFVSLTLKFDWTANGNVQADTVFASSASANITFVIQYSIDGGASWITKVTKSRSVFVGSNGSNSDSINNESGSEEVVLSASQNISQVQVRDRMDANASASTTNNIETQASASASITTTISNIRLEFVRSTALSWCTISGAMTKPGKTPKSDELAHPSSFCWNELCADYGTRRRRELMQVRLHAQQVATRWQCATCKKVFPQTPRHSLPLSASQNTTSRPSSNALRLLGDTKFTRGHPSHPGIRKRPSAPGLLEAAPQMERTFKKC